MAKGAGLGRGGGDGRGETTGEDVAVGSGMAVVFTVIMCVCGVPMIITGAVLVQNDITRTVGVALLVISLLLTVAAVVLIVLICAGCFGSRSSVRPVGVVMTVSPSIATTYSTGQVVVGSPVVSAAPPVFIDAGPPPPPYELAGQQMPYVRPEQQFVNSQSAAKPYPASQPVRGQ